jgi:hypothetical protein
MRELPLTKGVGAWVDDADFERFGRWKWRPNSKGWACRDGLPFTGTTGLVLLHRVIVGATSGQTVRPRNNVKLDCRRDNLLIEEGAKPTTRAAAEDLSVIVMRFVQAFPRQRDFPLPTLRSQLSEIMRTTGLDATTFLRRIEGWAAARVNIAPWDLEQPAPMLQIITKEIIAHRPTIVLPEPTPAQRAWVRAMQSPWEDDGTA